MKSILIYSFLLLSWGQLWGQTTVNRRIAQRHDAYIANAWVGQDSLIFNYAPNGKESYRMAWQGTTANNWENWFRITKTFDANQNIITSIQENWVNGNWVNSTKYGYTYDANNNKTETIYQTWNTTSTNWMNTGRNVFVYNLANKETKINSYIWQNSSWANSTLINNYYSNDTLLNDSQRFSWLNNSWAMAERFTYQYIQQYPTTITRYVLGNANWLPETQTTYLMNVSVTPARNEQTTIKKWDTVSNSWKNNQRTFYTFTANNLSESLTEIYNSNTSNWQSDHKYIHNYNTNNLLQQSIKQLFVNNQWANDSRIDFQYNTNNYVQQKDDLTWVNGNWKNNKQSHYQYNLNDSLTYLLEQNFIGSSFQNADQYFYYYGNVAVGQRLFEYKKNINLYPNPSSTSIYFSLPAGLYNQLMISSIYTMHGQLIWQRQEQANVKKSTICIKDLAEGTYFLLVRFPHNGQSFQSRFIKN